MSINANKTESTFETKVKRTQDNYRSPIADPRLRNVDAHKVGPIGGLAALSLDALSSVAYGPESIVLVLVLAGSAALRFTLPISIAIAVLLLLLVISYRQVIAVYPNGGGSYAVAKENLGGLVSKLAAASLVVDYVLTVTVSLSSGAASLGSAFPVLSTHLLAMSLVGLLILTILNLIGISETAKVLITPTFVFVGCVIATIIGGLLRSTPVAVIGATQMFKISETVGILLILKAFAAGCSALTGVEAIANAVPTFKDPAVKNAQRTEIMLGVILGSLLVGLAVCIDKFHMEPRSGVTILAQLSAAAFGKSWMFYLTNIIVALILALAANTSFGGLPVLMSLLAKDRRLPAVFALRGERPVYRVGVIAITIVSALILIVVDAITDRLIAVFAVGVFIGFTISQFGLVLYWFRNKPKGWVVKAIINAVGGILTFIAVFVLFISKFTEGAWLLLVFIPLLVGILYWIEKYYVRIDSELKLQKNDARPAPLALGKGLVIIPVIGVNRVVDTALIRAQSYYSQIQCVLIDNDHEFTETLVQKWKDWAPGFDLEILESPHKTVKEPLIKYVNSKIKEGNDVTVLLPHVEPKNRLYRILHNPRGSLLINALREHTSAIVATFTVRVK